MSAKLAERTADQIARDLVVDGVEEGENFGSEAELLVRYQVSRAVLREAIRLLEHRHVATMKKGPGGGLIVLSPSIDSILDALLVYLFYVGAETDEVFDVRLILEEASARLAAKRLTADGARRLDAFTTDTDAPGDPNPYAMHTVVSELTGNPALALFVEILTRTTVLFLPASTRVRAETMEASHGAHRAIATAVRTGDAERAARRMRTHLAAEAKYLQARRSRQRRLTEPPEIIGRSGKLAEHTAQAIFEDIASQGWPVGAHVGCEADLLGEHEVSRSVLREAVRLLEHHQIATMRRGPGGGLFIVEPGVDAIASSIAMYLEWTGIDQRDLFEVREILETAAVDHAAKALDREGVAELNETMAAETAAVETQNPMVGHDLHGVLARLSGNRVLEMLIDVLVELTRIRVVSEAGADVPSALSESQRAHRAIVTAVLSGDGDLAQRRMQRHLEALAPWTR